MRLIFASNNINKYNEVVEILGEKYKDFTFSLNDLDINVNPEETGSTYLENADIKAVSTYNALKNENKLKIGDIIFSDDTGLSIDYLDGAPSIKTARFMGYDKSQAEKNDKILELLEDAKDFERTAYFKTVISAIIVDKIENICNVFDRTKIIHFEGVVNGYIVREIVDFSGFGYDPIFGIGNTKDIKEGKVKTFSSIGKKAKNAISHRGIAILKLAQYLENNHYI